MAVVLDRVARLADVAKAAGVSQGTVSNVFNRPEVVREEVREHVRAVAKKLGFRGPDPKGRLLRAGKVNAIGIAVAEPLDYFFTDPFARELMRGISDACDDRGAGLSLISALNSDGLAWNVQNALVDGFVLLCIEGGERLVELTRERQLPFVALALGKPDPSISAVGVDDREGARVAAQHLIDLGHRRFGILALEFVDDRSGPVTMAEVEAAVYSTSRDRVHGYFDALGAAGIDTRRVPIYETLNDEATTHAALAFMFDTQEPPTALLCMSDRVALIAMDWLKARGLEVPGQVSIIGFDGIPEGATAAQPLTTISQPIADIGKRAIEIILEGGGKVRREILPTRLDIRASTAKAI
ncbi:MAG TPA: LacI family DNA-binding transcriptional regulator [Devosia sp.]|nr:LacI family DNA-binding transcriptional regulator [Devosia sp.]